MVSNKLTLLAASAALFDSALGFNAHRHLHNKRAMETDWVTEWVTVWVTPGEGDAVPASCTGAVTDAAASTVAVTTTAAAAESVVKHKASSKVSSTTTSTTVVVVPTSTTAVAADNNEAYYPQTTLTTAVKSKAAASSVAQSSEAAVQYTSSTSTQEEAVEAVTSVAQAATTTKAAATSKAAATTTSAAATSETETSTTSSSDTGINSKRGIAYNDAALANTFSSSCTNCGWAYNWGSARGDLDSSIPFIPTLWGNDASYTDVWNANAAAAIKEGSKVLFSFNEPDIAGQASLDAATAASEHVKWMNPFKGKALISAPSVSNSGTDGQGLSYLAEWVTACEALDEQCHYDFCNIHWYSEAQYSDTLFTQIAAAKKACGGKPIWLTEFAPTDTDSATIVSFMDEVLPKLDAISYLEGYSYFMVSADKLMSSSSSLSTTGQAYASA